MKRWYQLSMLQMLVALAVVACSIYLNVRVSRLEKPGAMPVDESKIGKPNTKHLSLSAGWPLTYLDANLIVLSEEGQRDDWRTLTAASQGVRWFPFLTNFTFAMILVMCVLFILHKQSS